jgi:phosphoribosyl-AMP cyclohydrolase
MPHTGDVGEHLPQHGQPPCPLCHLLGLSCLRKIRGRIGRMPATSLDSSIAARLKRNGDGLLPAIAQQYDTGEVLMLGWMDAEALHRTLTTGRCTYWSRSRQEYWVKGDTSGHVQHVKSVALDCDGDTVLVKVDQVGAACHTGDRTCFDADVLLTGP